MRDEKEVFAQAADLIEKHGHLKGDYGGPAEGFCVAGAVWWALAGQTRLARHACTPLNGEFVDLLDRLPQGPGGISGWNDNPRTTKADAIQLLRKAAA